MFTTAHSGLNGHGLTRRWSCCTESYQLIYWPSTSRTYVRQPGAGANNFLISPVCCSLFRTVSEMESSLPCSPYGKPASAPRIMDLLSVVRNTYYGCVQIFLIPSTRALSNYRRCYTVLHTGVGMHCIMALDLEPSDITVFVLKGISIRNSMAIVLSWKRSLLPNMIPLFQAVQILRVSAPRHSYSFSSKNPPLYHDHGHPRQC